MPGFLSQYEETTTVYFDDEKVWWAKVRRFLQRGDFKAAQTALITPEMTYVDDGDKEGEQKADTRGKVDTGAYQNELVVRALVEWNLTDAAGEPLPLTPDLEKRASVDRLPQETFLMILGAIEGAVGTKKKEEGKKPEAERFRGPRTQSPVGAAARGAATGVVAVPD